MMLYPSMAELMQKIESRYLLVNVIARRAREIADERGEDSHNDEKVVSEAIREIADGKLTVLK